MHQRAVCILEIRNNFIISFFVLKFMWVIFMEYTYKTKGTCAVQINFNIDGDVITNIKFVGGCPGNLNALSKLLEGKTVDYIVDNLEGNLCGMRGTSCADQFAKAVKEAKEKAKQ